MVKSKEILEIRNEMETLGKHLRYHNYRYYTLNNPAISDKEYDEMFYKLQDLEKKYPEFKSKNSPTEKVGTEILKNSLKKVEHKTPMLSLDKARNEEELRNWLEDLYQKTGEVDLGLYFKSDGLSLVLSYNENGYLEKAITRGNGAIGEDVTHSALQIPNIKNKILTNTKAINIRGEVVLPFHYLEEINKTRNEDEQYKTARNAASGILRNKEISEYIKYLEFQPHDQGILFLEYIKLSPSNIDKIINRCKRVENIERNKLYFDIDGVVIKIEDLLIRKEMGYTTHHPRWAIAYKFEAESEITILKDIKYQVSRTGRINPVGIIKPVELVGATISRVTLHNYDFIKEHQIKIGDKIEIARAGDVIPSVIKNHTKHEEYEFEYPKLCPECHGLTEFNEDGNFLYCKNSGCVTQTLYNFEYFIKKMDIKDVGIKTLEQIIEKYKLNIPYQLYRLSFDDFLALENTKEKKASKIYKNIQDSKGVDLWRVIASLGIEHVGSSLGKDLANYYKSLEAFSKAKYEELINLEGISDTIAQNIIDYINSYKGQDVINILYNVGKYEEVVVSTEVYQFAITGSFNLSRKEIKEILEKNGHSVKGFSGKTEILLAGDKAGSKLKKAESQGIEVWDREKTEEFINNLQ